MELKINPDFFDAMIQFNETNEPNHVRNGLFMLCTTMCPIINVIFAISIVLLVNNESVWEKMIQEMIDFVQK